MDNENCPELPEMVIKHYSEFINLMEAVKMQCSGPPKLSWTEKDENCLNQFLLESESEDINARKVQLIVDQIRLLGKEKKRRRYSPEMLITSFLIRARSAGAYRDCCKKTF